MKTTIRNFAFLFILLVLGGNLWTNPANDTFARKICSTHPYANNANMTEQTNKVNDILIENNSGTIEKAADLSNVVNSAKTAIDTAVVPAEEINIALEESASEAAMIGYLPDLFSFKSTSNKLTPKMKEMIQRAKPGTKIYFEDIQAVGPDGRVRTLAPICIIIK